MKLTKIHILQQNFKELNKTPYPTTCKSQLINHIDDDNIIEIIFNNCNNNTTISHTLKINHNTITIKLFNGKLITLTDFILIYIKINEIIKIKTPNHQTIINIPNNLYQEFINNKFNYNKKQFNQTTELVLLSILKQEHYELCQPLLDYRKNYFITKKWKFYDLNPDKISTLMDIINKNILS